ncbi:ATP-NAD kinase family protein [Actinomadura sp. HBU206391]|uniref:ATP-NAD kinase family protein n=1 Tax=Actinomadura sp. HBU206391 TaxID=2731692 RepID=UPI0016500040|nr:NAD(+)/NADH kinase [Actinomadura sp. HBU206391]MBC6457889.1 NAD(+)/NADH kinase [Actinomadura sp. HBU206391]
MTEGPSLGVVVNPIAGMGGRVGLHGTDGPALDAAVRRGAEAVAPHRARRALNRLHGLAPAVPVVAVEGPMGTDHLTGDGWTVRTLHRARTGPTTAADTRDAARAMVESGVSLLMFVGGDGTARDVVDAVGAAVPVLGVPSGVKMHSGVFATGPEAAGETAARYLAEPARFGCVDAEVVDLAGGDGASPATPRMFGIARVPDARGSLQRAKAVAGGADDADLVALGREVAREMPADRLYLLGPGTTVAHVNAALGLPASPLGVDAVLGGRLLAADASEAELLSLLLRHPSATLVLGVVGGQGFLLGRGNQQISAAVLAAVGTDNIEILAARGKVAALDPPTLRIDVGDEHATAPITGYRKVRTGRGRSTVLRIVA